MPTFGDLKSDVYRRTGAGTSPASEVVTRIGSFLNRWNRKILSKPGMEPLRRVTITKASVADQATYGIALQSISYMTETTTQREIYKKTLGWYRSLYPDPSRFTGTPTDYVPLGITRIHTRPSAACQLFAVSTSAADTAIVVRVQAIRSNGYEVSLSVTLTGVTPVSLGATFTDVIDILDVRLSAAAAGTVTITEGSGGTELSRLVIGETTPRFLRFALAPTPSQVITYSIDGIAQIRDLTESTDEPFENPDFHDLLVDGAVHDEWKSRGRSSDADALRVEIESRIRELRMSILEWPDGESESREEEPRFRIPIT